MEDPRTPEVMDKYFPGGFSLFQQRYAPQNFLDTPEAMAERAANEAQGRILIAKDEVVTESMVAEATRSRYIKELFEDQHPAQVWDPTVGEVRTFRTQKEASQFLVANKDGYIMPKDEYKAYTSYQNGYLALYANLQEGQDTTLDNGSSFGRTSPGASLTKVLDDYRSFGTVEEKRAKAIEVENAITEEFIACFNGKKFRGRAIRIEASGDRAGGGGGGRRGGFGGGGRGRSGGFGGGGGRDRGPRGDRNDRGGDNRGGGDRGGRGGYENRSGDGNRDRGGNGGREKKKFYSK
jgi:hypothetical protein